MRSWPVGRRVTSGWKTCPRTTPGAARSDRPFLFHARRAASTSSGVYRNARKTPVVEPSPSRLPEEVRADVLPDDLALARDLENPSVTAFADQRVAVGEPLRARNVRLKNSKSD